MGWVNPLTIIKMGLKRYREYPVEWFYAFLSLVFSSGLAPLFWFLVSGGRALGDWAAEDLMVLPIVFGACLSIWDFLDLWSLFSRIGEEDFRRSLTTLFGRPADPLFLLLAQNFNPTGFLTFLTYQGILGLIWAWKGFSPGFPVALLSAYLTIAALGAFLLAGGIVWGRKWEGLIHLLISYIFASEFPAQRELLSGFLLPLLAMAVLPARALAEELGVHHLVGFVLFPVSMAFWTWARASFTAEGE